MVTKYYNSSISTTEIKKKTLFTIITGTLILSSLYSVFDFGLIYLKQKCNLTIVVPNHLV